MSARLPPPVPDIPRATRVSASSDRRTTSGSASERANHEGARGEVRGQPCGIPPPLRYWADPGSDLRDHTKRSLGAQDQLAQRRPGRRVRRLERRELAGRRDEVQGGDELVEAAVPARRLPGGAGCGEPADRRE